MKIRDFALYIGEVDGETDFAPAKLYPVLEPENNDPQDYLRILDESGEDYLYPAQSFQIVELSQQVQKSLKHHFELAIA